MIWSFLTARGALGLAKGLWVLILLAVLMGAVVWLRADENTDDRRNQELGATVEREKALTETIERTETANEAREEISRPDDAGVRLRYDQCLRSARTPARCERFLPGGSAADR
jgi:hypothetical protein